MDGQNRFKGKVVLVTGSSRGIGKAIALAFAKEGAKIVVNYSKSEEEAKEIVKEIENISSAVAIKCDVSDEKQVESMIKEVSEKFGKLDILVNNAGRYIEGDEWNGTSKVWEETLKQNLISAMNTSKYATQVFQKQKEGIIINISSRFSVSGGFDAIAYSASKAGIVNITQAYSKLLAPYGRAVAVSPSAVNAGYWLRASKDELEEQVSSMPNKRLIEPEEIAEVVLRIASPESKLNGQNIVVDGSGKEKELL